MLDLYLILLFEWKYFVRALQILLNLVCFDNPHQGAVGGAGQVRQIIFIHSLHCTASTASSGSTALLSLHPLPHQGAVGGAGQVRQIIFIHCCWEQRPLGGTVDPSNSQAVGTFFRNLCTYIHIHSPLLTVFLCVLVFIFFLCAHSQVFRRTILHELNISNNHTEQSFCFSQAEVVLVVTEASLIKTKL